MAYYYEYRIKGLNKVDAQTAGEVCESLRNSDVGLTPASLLDASRAEDAPLHREFEWDNETAAENYRIEQARCLIKNLRVKVEQTGGEVITERAFVSVERGTTEYIPINVVLEDDDMTSKLLRQAQVDCRAFVEKYNRIDKLKEITGVMKKFLTAS